jgi:hypothetical protein
VPKSIWSFAKLIARALSTVQGATAVFLAIVGALRLERIITTLIGDYPALVAFLQPWVNQLIWFAAGIMICRAVYDQLRLSHVPEYMPVLDLKEPGEKQGWNFGDLDVLDIGKIMRQSGLDGTLTIWGRPGSDAHEVLWGPLIKIPQEHWATFDVYSLAIQSGENRYIVSTNTRNPGERGYFDLHVDREPALWWLKHVAWKERGKRAKLEAERDARIVENRAIIEQQKAEAAARAKEAELDEEKERANRASDPHARMG